MSNFSQCVADLTSEGVAVIEVIQHVSGTAWQKTAHRINRQVAEGKRRIAVVTNSNNPCANDIELMVQYARVAMPTIEIGFHKQSQ